MRQCTVCGGTGAPIGMVRFDASLSQCNECGLIFLSNWPEGFQEDLYDYYEEWLEWPKKQLFPDINRRRIQERLRELGAHVDGRRLLDVGCGHGGIVLVASESGWHAEGIELSESAVAVAERFGLNCSLMDFFDVRLDGRRFDVIVMSELIEHVSHPVAFLQRGRELLAQEGAIYLTTPNWNSLDRWIMGSQWRAIHREHLSYFAPETLRYAVREAGLEISSLWTENISLTAIKKLLGRAPHEASTGVPQADATCRETIERSRLLRAGKWAVNQLLRATGTGVSMKAVLTE